MQHIRSARELPRRHCIYGLDADLIMLGLATHAPAIVLLREKVVFRSPRADSPNKVSLVGTVSNPYPSLNPNPNPKPNPDPNPNKVSLEGTGEFTLLHIDLLRRYLDLEFRTMVLPCP